MYFCEISVAYYQNNVFLAPLASRLSVPGQCGAGGNQIRAHIETTQSYQLLHR